MAGVPAPLQQWRDAAAFLLGHDEVGPELTRQIESKLREHLAAAGSLRAVCESHADAIARQLGEPLRASHVELTTTGWVIANFGKVRPHHVYAVAAMLEIEGGEGSDPSHELERDVAHLMGEAMFMAGRHNLARQLEHVEAIKRSKRGALGGRPVVVTDDQIRARWEAYLRDAGGKTHGAIGKVANRLGIDAKALSKRLRKIGIRK